MNAEVDIAGVIIKTERLVLRPFELGGLDDFYEYASVDGVGQMAGWLPHKNKEESLVILNKFIDYKKTFAITYNGKVVSDEMNENIIKASDVVWYSSWCFCGIYPV